ncbi:MAG TPA: hypothetical protein VFV82_10745 [Candidatus Binatia bacterium]|nr:hypothetical protein [Candidatus Binatia bacterium]
MSATADSLRFTRVRVDNAVSGVRPSGLRAKAQPISGELVWLFSRRTDFWLACGGASVALLAAMLLILVYGDRELDALDLVLSEFHLGATYYAVVQRRLWRQRAVDVVLVPLGIIGLTFALSLSGQTLLLTSAAMYAAVWHRGRQSLGVARFYQRAVGGIASPVHKWLFQGAIYMPMLAALLAYTHLSPLEYEGEPYLALHPGGKVTATVTIAAAAWVMAYVAWTILNGFRTRRSTRNYRRQIHPGERWVVLAHSVAFGSAYLLGAVNASFLLVLTVHHELQYIYFVFATSRRFSADTLAPRNPTELGQSSAFPLSERQYKLRAELSHGARFLLLPMMAVSGAFAGAWVSPDWLAPLGAGGLFCHYWLDGRIWTRRSFQT